MKKTVIMLLVIIVAIILLFVALMDVASADTKYILCKPETEINVRRSPKFRGEIIGHLYFGDRVELDGSIRNGFAQVGGFGFEVMEGWLYTGLLVDDPPMIYEATAEIVSSGRVAARQYINGKRNKWLKPGKEVYVYAISREWSITDQGYIKTAFLSAKVPE